MQDNQNKQQSGGQSNPNGGKQQQPLSWSQPSSGPKDQQKAAPAVATTVATANKPASRAMLAFVIGLIVGWLVTWSWFDLRSSGNTNVASNASSTSQTTGTSAITETKSGSTSQGSDTASAGANLTQGNSATMNMGRTSTDTITVPSPQNAGTSVIVANLDANDVVWAVVYEDNGGKTGRILGARRFSAGEKSGTVELLRSTLPNLNYFVGLVGDTADHTFGVHTNAPLLDQSGQQIMTKFMAQ